MDDEADPVVAEYPVYTSVTARSRLYLFQYPIRSAAHPYAGDQAPLQARLKPQAGALELDVPIDTRKHYSHVRGLDYAADSSQPDYDLDYAVGPGAALPLDRQILEGTLQTNRADYIIGVLRNGAFYTTPIKSAVQLRPSFRHVTMAAEREKRVKRDREEQGGPNGVGPTGPASVRLYQVSAKSSEDAPEHGLSGNEAARRQFEEEDWIRLHWHDQPTVQSQLFCASETELIIEDLKECFDISSAPLVKKE